MKCVKCGNQTKGNKIVCSSCINTDVATNYIDAHKCHSFKQMKDAIEGVCQNVFLCQPIKKALKNEMLFERGLGHIVCPYPSINLSYITYNDFSQKDLELLEMNYEECFN